MDLYYDLKHEIEESARELIVDYQTSTRSLKSGLREVGEKLQKRDFSRDARGLWSDTKELFINHMDDIDKPVRSLIQNFLDKWHSLTLIARHTDDLHDPQDVRPALRRISVI
eukprot:TRINITY_DN3493_c0_g1_i2.p1 TRINITY_DN3493_c0_g1~~TRINITY_DN3493_c0_g1_i2.p1  ORF type:complete len:131 (-),score=13.16 TRINITY_DN3493_c0_g1_i2:478-813(-)